MAREVVTPSELSTPAFLMCFPFSVANRTPNNVWMVDKAPYNLDRAFRQWLDLYKALAEEAIIYLMPHGNGQYQDITYVANVGAFIPHKNKILLANFNSMPRRGEEIVAQWFFHSLGYEISPPPFYWEGEADLKYVRDNIYVGGYGIRTDQQAYDWMSAEFDMVIVQVKLTDERLYHLDCLFFPIDSHRALVSTSVLDPADVKKIEKYVEIIDVPPEHTYDDGWTNAVRLNSKIVVNTPANRASQVAIEDLIVKVGYEPILINMSEFKKSGADASCLVMHLNFNNR